MRLLLVLLFGLAAGSASAADLKLLTAGAYKSSAIEIVAEFEKKTGHKVTIDTGTAGALQKRVAGGEYFDVVVIPPIAMAPLLAHPRRREQRQGAGPRRRRHGDQAGRARCPTSPRSTASRRRCWRRAPSPISIRRPAGSSGIYLAQLFQQMGIADQLKPKSVLVQGGLVADRIVDGKADIALQQSSELMGVPGVQFVGPIPLMVQNYTIYSGGVALGSGNRAAADALLLALANPENGKILKSKGLDSP